ncbi:unnamed protein product [Rhizoctonia solani]|uniref:C2H2-type domain-containing protein n=1 Tax=Rhizoctonia solani TaxID=456999 RepID=A0A8H3A6A4_9AGAM|nr:unnamed protein product [Rhizoctonia solani]
MERPTSTTVRASIPDPLAFADVSLKRKAYHPLTNLDPPPPYLSPLCDPKTDLTCNECGRGGWNSPSALSRHVKTHAKKKDRPHRCEHCDMTFTQRTALNTHNNTHTGARPHPCRAGCNDSFADPSSRTRHENERHNPSHGFKCLRVGCNESFKRKCGFTMHMVKAHSWPASEPISEVIYVSARNKCAEDYMNNNGKRIVQLDISSEGSDGVKTNHSEDDAFLVASDEKPKFNRKRLRSGSASSGDSKPPPAKKQAIDPNLSRRNAVCSIDLPAPQHINGQHLSHQRSDSDDHSISTASSFVDTFSGCYQPADHRFASGSPPRHLSSSHEYDNAMGRVHGGSTPVTQGLHMQVPMHPMPGNYGVSPTSVSPRMTMPDPVHYQSSSSRGVLSQLPWSTPSSSYSDPWPFESGMSQVPHGVSPAHAAHEDMSPRGVLPPTRSGGLHTTRGDINPSMGGHQAEPPSGSSLDPHYGQAAGGAFRDHQVPVRIPSDHSPSSYPDSHTQGMFELKHSRDGATNRSSHIPRSVIGHGSERSYQ